jgi:hypothetical protein
LSGADDQPNASDSPAADADRCGVGGARRGAVLDRRVGSPGTGDSQATGVPLRDSLCGSPGRAAVRRFGVATAWRLSDSDADPTRLASQTAVVHQRLGANPMWVASQTPDAHRMLGAGPMWDAARTLAVNRRPDVHQDVNRWLDRAQGADPQKAWVLVRGDRRKAKNGWQPVASSAMAHAAGLARSAPPVAAAPSGWGEALF